VTSPPLLNFLVQQITAASSPTIFASVDDFHAPLQWVAAQLIMVLSQSSPQVGVETNVYSFFSFYFQTN
jgi:hypothetical protein